MGKRFTDTDKWKDEWYTELPNDYKVIWQYLLDTCDNAGIYKRNIKLLNYYCNTNVSADDILNVFKDRVSPISDDKWIINKFCVFQYGNDFLQSKNKAVVSAINKLIENKLYDNSTNTILIPYPYSIDTPKEQEQDKSQEQEQVKNIDEVKNVVIDTDKARLEASKRLNQIVDIKEKNDWVLAKKKLNELVDDYGSLEYVVQSVFNNSNIETKYINDLSQLKII